MHLDQSALGILRKAEDKNGRKYMDWRIPYMDQPGLIMVYKSDSRYEKYQVYFFTSPASDCPGKYLHTTYGSIQVEDGSLTIRTKNSVYEFELDASCVSEVDMILLLHTVNEYFRDVRQTMPGTGLRERFRGRFHSIRSEINREKKE